MTVTVSGAHRQQITAEAALRFLSRSEDADPPVSVDAAFGAFEDNGNLIGLTAALWDTGAGHAKATVAVSPDRRRLKVGSDLLYHLLRHAEGNGVRYLAFNAADAGPIEYLAGSLGLTVASQGQHHTTTTTVVAMAPRPLERCLRRGERRDR